ncbi:hypothetical protein [Pseudoalteromonas luteoviolacea]|uniref:DUF4393 domain-containing protein n=1 Tax=Pseudoalteromonas luteoviolacea (strain 2ta16) TaxID=1353533 RepID=V4H4U9_PSEL2|nr:hypothetical protein [Pseudoalteromonas luteoviolacea]ESP92506.1 hypothetical protein PL2TA16_04315 [Pseudoalteromonas luteoviolacea 2ta16]KZN35066.1 hypothetical protein N483_24295 [Pseudoalteromonas luteoviolacea NCIMB 1944]
MSEDSNENPKENKDLLDEAFESGSGSKVARFALSVLGGLVPFAGGAIGGAAGAWSESESEKFKNLLHAWLKMQQEEVEEIGQTLFEVMERLDQSDEKIRERIESKEYLSLVKKCFRDWAAAESEEKRVLIRNLLANSASCKLTSDGVVRLFIEWIENFSEAHFAVIREVFTHQNITRYGMWRNIHGESVREDSAEADLFKLIIHDLSIGHVIRQYRPVDYHGNFIKQPAQKRQKGYSSNTMKSAFDNEKQYVLTELGKQFVHYTMNEIVGKLNYQENA